MTKQASKPATFEIVSCPWCGQDFRRTSGRRGRPRLHCSDACKEAEVRLRQAEAAIQATIRRMGKDEAKALRRRLWGMANLTNTAGRDLDAPAPRVPAKWVPALEILLGGGTKTEAAIAAGIDEATLAKWARSTTWGEWLAHGRREAASNHDGEEA